MKKYVRFIDMHDDGVGGTFEVTDKEFALLLPYQDDMGNGSPVPKNLQTLLWDEIYDREQSDVNPNNLSDDQVIIQALC